MPAPVEDVPTADAEEGPAGGGKPFRRINGQVYIIDNDEYVTEDDPKGDAKIDQYGNLIGDRKFKAQTFQLPNRHPDRMYMLAIDAARTSGFRDSLYYFRRNPLAMKLNATQAEKEYLIEVGKLGSHLRTRSVTMITARSAYKLHGAKTVKDGKWVFDDYYEDKALEECTAKGLKPGDPVDEPQDTAAAAPELTASKDRTGSGIGLYRAGGPTTIFGGSGWGPYSDGPLNAVRKSLLTRDGLNEENWMYAAAQRTADASREWANMRAEAMKVYGGTLDGSSSREQEARDRERETGKRRKVWDEKEQTPLGVYEPHSGTVYYRSDTQPTRARWEPVDDGQRVLGGTKAGSQAWGLAWVDTIMETPRPEEIDEENAVLRGPFLQYAEQPP
ncbi:chromatin remodelling complex Rsc7/Swp82 subunit-domain-containing protein [Fomitopsis serialis]|uniref:chromatin remodelling complex Rsc7/Swp82 subunit-domain-containing protein n=1 Tax=Fomitopsis serialis TaxID=139415 RepID=UPI00200853EC|nr:chromatin remodelling complex Rsc7/Swp82 subunit-domain-containing protein [Neoantrodia serialis]KAH9934143.1 chromatin remodelling complex Rsc7/Swp82 subunit-domain-containing protein [Neoantrodia serialis]